MKIKYEIERKIEGDNGKKSEKETTITFDDLPDVKKKVKGVGAFLAKQAKKTAESAELIAGVITYNAAALTANALDSVAETADIVVNAIDRFLDKNYEIVEEDSDEESCDGQCCGECCCGETCEDDLADVIEEIINELEGEDNESDEDGVENDADEETAEDDFSAKTEESPVKIFIKGVIGDLVKISDDIISFVKASDEERAETFKKVDDYLDNLAEEIANHFGAKFEKSEKTSEEEETADEDEIEKVSDDSSESTESDEVSDSKKDFADKIAEIPECKKFTLAEYLDYLDVYNCEEKTVNMEKEACIFFAAIGYPASYVSRIAFENSVTLDHINYNSVSEKVMERIPYMKKDEIIEKLKSDFDKWLETREDVKMYCPKPTFRFLLKYFVKKIRLS